MLRWGAVVAEIRYDSSLGDSVEKYIFLVIPFDVFRIFRFLDDTGSKHVLLGLRLVDEWDLSTTFRWLFIPVPSLNMVLYYRLSLY